MNLPTCSLEHLIKTGAFIVQTPDIDELSNIMCHWHGRGAPGGMVLGPPGSGKTIAILYFEKKGTLLDGVPIVTGRTLETFDPKSGKIHAHILWKFGHDNPESCDSSQDSRLISNSLLKFARDKGADSLCLLIDEAEVMTVECLGLLSCIYDALNLSGVRAFFILFAKPCFRTMANTLNELERNQTVRRFLAQTFKFSGIRDTKGLKTFLSKLDSGLAFPPKGGATFSQHYLTEAFAKGWRLSEEAGTALKAFKKIHEEESMPRNFVIPIKYLIAAVSHMLLSRGNTNDDFHGFSLSQWEEAVKFSGYDCLSNYLPSNTE